MSDRGNLEHLVFAGLSNAHLPILGALFLFNWVGDIKSCTSRINIGGLYIYGPFRMFKLGCTPLATQISVHTCHERKYYQEFHKHVPLSHLCLCTKPRVFIYTRYCSTGKLGDRFFTHLQQRYWRNTDFYQFNFCCWLLTTSDWANYIPRVGGASQPRSKHVSEGNSLRDVAPGNHVHVSYVGE